jgi:hypothetical protein
MAHTKVQNHFQDRFTRGDMVVLSSDSYLIYLQDVNVENGGLLL